jgi:chromosome segregation ATPase
MQIEKSYSGMLGGLARLTAALAANSAELPHLEGVRARLEKIVTEAQEVAKQQAALTASKQDSTKQLKSLLTEGQRVATGLQKLLKENYGLRAEKLAEFGLKPFRGRKTKSQTPETPGAPSPSPTPNPPTVHPPTGGNPTS